MPRLKRQSRCKEKRCLFPSLFQFCLLPQSGREKREGGHVSRSKAPASLSQTDQSPHTKFKLRRRQRSRSRGYFCHLDLSCLSPRGQGVGLPTGKAVACSKTWNSTSMTKGCRYLSPNWSQNNLSKLAHSNHRSGEEWMSEKKKITSQNIKRDDLGCQVGKASSRTLQARLVILCWLMEPYLFSKKSIELRTRRKQTTFNPGCREGEGKTERLRQRGGKQLFCALIYLH